MSGKKPKGIRKTTNTIEQGLKTALSPVNPGLFSNKVQTFLQGVGVIVTPSSLNVIEKLSRLFNYSIANPKVGGFLNQKNILIYPAETGIGKSVSIQHYVAMLNTESSLIVVNTIAEAEEYCEKINSIRNQGAYAKFYVSKDTKNRFQIRLTADAIEVQCLVITHNQFLKLPFKDDFAYFRMYAENKEAIPKNRDLVVIDERLPLTTKKYLEFNKLEGITNFLSEALKHSPSLKDSEELKQQFRSIQTIVDVINEEQSSDETKKTAFIDRLTIEPKLEDQNLPARIDF